MIRLDSVYRLDPLQTCMELNDCKVQTQLNNEMMMKINQICDNFKWLFVCKLMSSVNHEMLQKLVNV